MVRAFNWAQTHTKSEIFKPKIWIPRHHDLDQPVIIAITCTWDVVSYPFASGQGLRPGNKAVIHAFIMVTKNVLEIEASERNSCFGCFNWTLKTRHYNTALKLSWDCNTHVWVQLGQTWSSQKIQVKAELTQHLLYFSIFRPACCWLSLSASFLIGAAWLFSTATTSFSNSNSFI